VHLAGAAGAILLAIEAIIAAAKASAPTRFTPAMAFSPRTRSFPKPAAVRAWCLSAVAGRHQGDGQQGRREEIMQAPACLRPAIRARPERRTMLPSQKKSAFP